MRKSLIYLILIPLLSLVSACGGGTEGTGGVQIEGKILSEDNVPLSNINVSVTETGDSDLTDADGNFLIDTQLRSSIELEFRGDGIDAKSKIDNIPSSAKKVSATFRANKKKNTVDPEDVKSEDSSSSGDDRGGSNSGSSNDSSDDDKGDDNSSSRGDTPSDDKNPNKPDSSDDNSNVRKVEEKGPITAISDPIVTVNSTSFTVTSQSKLKDKDGKRTTLSTFKIGDLVRAKGKQSSGVVTLEELEIDD